MTLLLEVTEYGDAANWHWRLTEEAGGFIADHQGVARHQRESG